MRAAAMAGLVIVGGCRATPQPEKVFRPSPSVSQGAAMQRESVYLGRPVQQPETLSGIWEAPDGRGGAVGLGLGLLTSISSDRVSLAGAPQAWGGLDALLYERTSAPTTSVERNGFTDRSEDGLLRYESRRLTLHWGNFDLDLKRGHGDTWVGRFHRLGFDRVVTLKRPRTVAKGPGGWFLGTWMEGDGWFQQCLHLGREPDGSLAGWSDSFQELGNVRYGPHVTKPEEVNERYGALAEVRVLPGNQVSVQMDVNDGWCCPGGFVGTKAPDGGMRAEWNGGRPGGVHKPTIWRPVTGASCTTTH